MNKNKASTIRIHERTKKLLKKINRDLKFRCNSYEEIIEKLLNVGYSWRELKELEKLKPKEQEDESIRCSKRVFVDGKYYCVKNPPRTVKLKTLDVCRVCKAKEHGFSDSTKMKAKTEDRSWRKDKNRTDMRKAGMVFCPEYESWLFPNKCSKCENENCKHHPKKKKEKVKHWKGKTGRKYA